MAGDIITKTIRGSKEKDIFFSLIPINYGNPSVIMIDSRPLIVINSYSTYIKYISSAGIS
jgi:hypothetical protein